MREILTTNEVIVRDKHSEKFCFRILNKLLSRTYVVTTAAGTIAHDDANCYNTNLSLPTVQTFDKTVESRETL